MATLCATRHNPAIREFYGGAWCGLRQAQKGSAHGLHMRKLLAILAAISYGTADP